MTKKSNLSIIIFLFVLLLSPSLLFADDIYGGDPFYDAPGFDQFRETFGAADFEHYDPFTGGLTLNYEDVHIPGNGGLDLIVQRSFNSKNVCKLWTQACGTNGCTVTCSDLGEDSWVGLGWTMHFGKVIDMGANVSPIIEMPDGSRHQTYKNTNTSTFYYITKEYWGINRDSTYHWILTLSDGRKIYFEQSENPGPNITEYFATKIEDTNGNVINVAYQNPSHNTDYQKYGSIKSVTDSDGRVTNFTLTTSLIAGRYRLKEIVRPDQKKITFDYTGITSTSRALLTRVAPPEGNSWVYTYDTSDIDKTIRLHDLTKVTTPYGGIIDYTYATEHLIYGPSNGMNYYSRALKTKELSGRDILPGTWSFLYYQGTNNEYTYITDPCNRTIKYRYFGFKSVYNQDGSMWKIGLPISKETVGEETVAYAWTPSAAFISYDDYLVSGVGNDIYIYVPYLSTQAITRGSSSYTTTYSSFDSYGNPQSISEAGNGTRNRSLTYWYNTAKNIVHGKPASETVSGTLSNSFTTNYTYDTDGNPTQENRYGITTNRAYLTNGNLSSVTDPRGYPTSYLWNNGVISKSTNPLYFTSRVVNPIGTIASETNGRSYTTSYTYDGNLRLTRIDPPAGNSTSITYQTDNSYKTESRGGYWLKTFFEGLGRPTGTTDSKGVTTTIVWKACGLKDNAYSNIGDTIYYDNFGRTTKILHKDGSQILYAYSGNTVTVTDEAGKHTKLNYTAFGSPDDKMLTSVIDSLYNSTTYTRNILGSLTGITQGSVSRSFTFDSKNFLIGESHPETGSITYGRDNNGNMTSRNDASGTVNYTYDQINRLTDISFGGDTITYDYDKADNRTSMTSPGASASYVYDAVNRMTSQSKTISGRAFTTGYGYDGNDNLTSLTYPKGLALIYGYNTNNQMTSATSFGGSVTGIGYNTAGLPTGFNYSNGKNTTITYNTRNMTTQINAGTAYNTSFGYDSKGNTTSITDNLPATPVLTHKIDPLKGSLQTTNYGYSSNRMTSLSGSETASYVYNGRGDMTSLTEQGATFTPVFDLLHNLTAYKQGTTTIAAYGYDGDGLRVTKAVGGVTTVYHHDMSGKLLSETDANGNRIVDYVYVNGNMAAKVETSGVSYYHTDPAGTPVAITDSAGALVWRAEYLPFGEEQLLVNTKVNDKMFVGKEKDEETGLYYFGARYMQDRNARFVSVDPVGPVDPSSSKTYEKMLLNPQKLNRYAYALNNPYRYVDPDGRVIEVVGSKSEKKLIEQGLKSLKGKSQTAKKVLKELENSKEVVRIKSTDSGNSYNPADNIIEYNPNQNNIYDGSEKWHYRPPEVGLSHEAIHSLHDIKNELGDTREVEESKTVGIDNYSKAPLTENQIRKEYGIERRPKY